MSETGDAPGSDRTPANLELLLLAVLAREPLHGYAIIVSLRELSGGLFDLNEGSAYPALHRLERTGMVQSEWSEVQGRRRRVYRLTREGRRALADRRSLWQRTVDAVGVVLGPLPARSRRKRST